MIKKVKREKTGNSDYKIKKVVNNQFSVVNFATSLIFLAFIFALALLPFASAQVCSVNSTQRYLAEGTSYIFQPKLIDYVIVIDRSGSMEGERINTVKEAASSLIEQLSETDRAAIISFNYDSTVDQPLTSDKELLKTSVESLRASFSTQYSPPLRSSQGQFLGSNRDKALIFLSDGKSDFSETPEQIRALTEALAKDGVCIMTISYALGNEESPQLKEMAEIGKQYGCGENFFASEKGTELEEVFSKIRDTISSTDIIEVKPTLNDNIYSFSFQSKLNNKPIPGVSDNACAEEPEFTMEVFRSGELVKTVYSKSGSLDLPQGVYSYRATANLRCAGECSFAGYNEGTISVTGVCNPTYAELATYVTGETQIIKITPGGFVPSAIAGKQGTAIIWNNTDSVTRKVSSAFFNATIPPGGQHTYIVNNIGTLIFTDPESNQILSIASVAATGSDVLLIVDQSGSMRGNPILEASNAAKNFFATLSPSDRGALMTFSHAANIEQDFTSDRQSLIRATEKLHSQSVTSYLAAINLATTMRPSQRPIMVFMSDGVPTDQQGEEAIIDATEKLRSQGWCIMTVGFGQEGADAKRVLSRMAGQDACSGFLYASAGELSRTFGTIYQLAQRSNDIIFNELTAPKITFKPVVEIKTKLVTRTGKPIPGGDAQCAPIATLQVRTKDTFETFTFDGENYVGKIPLSQGAQKMQLVASLVSIDEPSRPLVGSTTVTVTYIPFWTIIVIIISLLVALTIGKKYISMNKKEAAAPGSEDETYKE